MHDCWLENRKVTSQFSKLFARLECGQLNKFLSFIVDTVAIMQGSRLPELLLLVTNCYLLLASLQFVAFVTGTTLPKFVTTLLDY